MKQSTFLALSAAALTATMGFAGCPAAPDPPPPVEPPAGCDAEGLLSVRLGFSITFGEDIYTVDDWLASMADAGVERYEAAFVGMVAALTDENGQRTIRIEPPPPEDDGKGDDDDDSGDDDDDSAAEDETPFITLETRLPSGYEIPVQEGQLIAFLLGINAAHDKPRTAFRIMEFDEEEGAPGALLFYAEPGSNEQGFYDGMAYDGEELPSGVFTQAGPEDYGCPVKAPSACGDLFNLALSFETMEGEAIELWPGETAVFASGEQMLEVVNVWSYDWRDVTCDTDQFERNYAFFVVGR